jgi:hypothetical protein
MSKCRSDERTSIGDYPLGLRIGRCDLFPYDHTLSFVGMYQGESPTSCHRDSQIPNFPKTGNPLTRRPLNRTVHNCPGVSTQGKSRFLVAKVPDSTIPDFPKWEILRHMASVNRMAKVYPRVFTMENPELLSIEISIL